MAANNLQVVNKKTEDLIPYVNNARTHSEDQITQIASSIKEFGFLNPVIIDGSNGIIAGHGRLLAAKKLGLEEVPTVSAEHLTDAQRKAYILADNKIALNSGWDDELLKLELDALKAETPELAELTGFSVHEIEHITNPPEIYIDDFFIDTEEENKEEENTPPNTIKCPKCGEIIEI